MDPFLPSLCNEKILLLVTQENSKPPVKMSSSAQNMWPPTRPTREEGWKQSWKVPEGLCVYPLFMLNALASQQAQGHLRDMQG